MRSTTLFACLLALTTFGATSAAPPGRERAHTYLMARVVDALGLSSNAADRMRDILRRADAHRLELTAERGALDARLRTTLAHTPVDQSALARLVADTDRVQRELGALPARTFDEVRKLLTVEQQAKFLVLGRDLQGEVRQAMRRRGQGPSATQHPQ